MAIARPGNTPSQGARCTYVWAAPFNMPPQDGDVRRDTDPEEAEGGLRDDRRTEKDRDEHDVQGQAIGDHAAENDARVAGPDRPGGQYVVHFLDGQGLGAEDPGGIGDVGDAERDDDVVQGCSQSGHDGNRQNQRREGHQGIDYSLDDEVGLAAEMDARNAHHHADGGPDERAEQPGVQRNPCAIDEPAEHVTAQLVAAQQQLRSGRRKDESPVRLGGVVRGNQRGKDSDDDEDQGDHGPECPQGLSPGKAD